MIMFAWIHLMEIEESLTTGNIKQVTELPFEIINGTSDGAVLEWDALLDE